MYTNKLEKNIIDILTQLSHILINPPKQCIFNFLNERKIINKV